MTTDYTISILIEKNVYKDIDRNPKEKEYKIIWHPVMIWDVLDWIDKEHKLFFTYKEENSPLTLWADKVVNLWKDKRKPIDDQSEECIDFIYNLIQEKNLPL